MKKHFPQNGPIQKHDRETKEERTLRLIRVGSLITALLCTAVIYWILWT